MERQNQSNTHRLIYPIIINILLVMLLSASVKSKSTPPSSAASDNFTYLPIVSSPEVFIPSEEAILRIDPGGGLNGSTFTPGSFLLTNPQANTQPISQVRIDLSTAIFPDMVFDPNGSAGDTVAKNLEINGGTAVYQNHTFANPHDGGFDVIEIHFDEFEPGESFTFSIDVDPTSIKGTGAPGPSESGSVSGIELVGTTVTITFADGTIINGQPYRIPNSVSGAEVLARKGLPAAPTLQLLGNISPPAAVSEANQTIRISGTPNRPVKLLLVEGGLFTAGVPGGGFDLDAFEANSALIIQEYAATTSLSGNIDIPITLLRSHTAGGLNYIVAIQENIFGMQGMVSAPIVLEYVVP